MTAIENLINKNKGLEEISREYDDLIKLYAEALNTCEELEKMIELMADRLTHYRISNDGANTRLATREEKIDYFRKKAKGE